MSEPIKPIRSALPGIAHLRVPFDLTAMTARFIDKGGVERVIQISLIADPGGQVISLLADDGSAASFKPCSPPNETLWFATGLKVQTEQRGIGSAFYALVRDLLKPKGHSITPSGNLFEGGVMLWAKMDPSIAFKEQQALPGYFEPA